MSRHLLPPRMHVGKKLEWEEEPGLKPDTLVRNVGISSDVLKMCQCPPPRFCISNMLPGDACMLGPNRTGNMVQIMFAAVFEFHH